MKHTLLCMNKFDFVTRISHNHDVVFQIMDFYGEKAILKGVDYRLIADADITDLNRVEGPLKIELPRLNIASNIIPGKVLHIDGDKSYVEKAKEIYHKYKVPAKCLYIDEEAMPVMIKSLLLKEKYDVLVITGHDFLKNDKQQSSDVLTRYENSINFVGAVQQARLLYSDLDSLIIIAGACQSNYEALMASGANIASSPSRSNIHLLDPLIAAVIIATTSIKEYVLPEDIVNKTISKALGGVESKGKARVHYAGDILNGNIN